MSLMPLIVDLHRVAGTFNSYLLDPHVMPVVNGFVAPQILLLLTVVHKVVKLI